MGNAFSCRIDPEIAYRVLVPLPVTVAWPSGAQTLRYDVSDFPAFTDIVLASQGAISGFIVGRYKSVSHAKWAVERGIVLAVKPPTVVGLFLDRLVREGRAEIVAGPHCRITWYDRSKNPPPFDAYWTWPQLQNHRVDFREHPRIP